MKDFVLKLYRCRPLSAIFHTLIYCLQRELKGSKSVLDLGCGPNSPIRQCDVKYSVGVDGYNPYILESKKNQIHNKYILAEISKIKFKEKSFDTVILIDVIEHLEKKEGEVLLKKVENWARKKIIVNTPNGFVPGIDPNPFQIHRSGWTIKEMQKKGYKAYGMAGWKLLRKDATGDIKKEGFVTIRFRPKSFWFIIAGFTQLFTYYFPQQAFEVLYVKKIDE